MDMRLALFLTFAALSAQAGTLEYQRDADKVRAEHAYTVATKCKTQPEPARSKCIKDANALLANVLGHIRRQQGVSK